MQANPTPCRQWLQAAALPRHPVHHAAAVKEAAGLVPLRAAEGAGGAAAAGVRAEAAGAGEEVGAAAVTAAAAAPAAHQPSSKSCWSKAI